jgi:hypothetical protein
MCTYVSDHSCTMHLKNKIQLVKYILSIFNGDATHTKGGRTPETKPIRVRSRRRPPLLLKRVDDMMMQL